MTPQDFCYWLQGFSELNGSHPSPDQWNLIKEHLALTFKKVTRTLGPTIAAPAQGPFIPHKYGGGFNDVIC